MIIIIYRESLFPFNKRRRLLEILKLATQLTHKMLFFHLFVLEFLKFENFN